MEARACSPTEALASRLKYISPFLVNSNSTDASWCSNSNMEDKNDNNKHRCLLFSLYETIIRKLLYLRRAPSEQKEWEPPSFSFVYRLWVTTWSFLWKEAQYLKTQWVWNKMLGYGPRSMTSETGSKSQRTHLHQSCRVCLSWEILQYKV